MICQQVTFDSPWIVKIYALRQAELRQPLKLNLFDEDLLSEREELFFCVCIDDQLISCLQLRKLENGSLKLRQMATRDDSKGKGYGRHLVSFAEQWASKAGYPSIELHARKVAQGFYEKLGYNKVGAEFLEVEIPHYKMVKSF